MNEVTKIEAQETLPADPMISMIERVVMDPNADVEKLERLLAMKERLDEKASKKAFDLALADAKAEIPPILKTGVVDYLNTKNERTYFKHETLDGIAKIVDPILSNFGLSYRYRSRQENGQLYVTCIVAHRDGYSEETTLQGGPDSGAGKNNYQAVGSAATYLQRYTLKLALGLSAAKDDDATFSEGGQNTVSAEQFTKLQDLIAETDTDEGRFLKAFNANDLQQFPSNMFDKARQMLERKRGSFNA